MIDYDAVRMSKAIQYAADKLAESIRYAADAYLVAHGKLPLNLPHRPLLEEEEKDRQ